LKNTAAQALKSAKKYFFLYRYDENGARGKGICEGFEAH